MIVLSPNTKVHVIDEPWNNTIAIYVIQDHGSKRFSLKYLDEGVIEQNEIIDGQLNDPQKHCFLRIPADLALPIVNAVRERFGIKDVVNVSTDAELKAMSYHLEDMRKLVFKKG